MAIYNERIATPSMDLGAAKTIIEFARADQRRLMREARAPDRAANSSADRP
jgi:hypothetical protein